MLRCIISVLALISLAGCMGIPTTYTGKIFVLNPESLSTELKSKWTDGDAKVIIYQNLTGNRITRITVNNFSVDYFRKQTMVSPSSLNPHGDFTLLEYSKPGFSLDGKINTIAIGPVIVRQDFDNCTTSGFCTRIVETIRETCTRSESGIENCKEEKNTRTDTGIYLDCPGIQRYSIQEQPHQNRFNLYLKTESGETIAKFVSDDFFITEEISRQASGSCETK